MPRAYIIITTILIFLVAQPASAGDDFTQDSGVTLGIDEALDIARENNLELKAALEGISAARMGVKAAKALDLFTLSLSTQGRQTGPPISADIPGAGEVVVIPSEFQTSASLTLSQPVYTFGLNRRVKELANLALATARFEYETQLDDIQFRVESAYYDLVYLGLLIEVQEQDLQRAENDKNNAELRYEAGQVARFEVIRADVAVKNAEEALIGTRKTYELAKLGWMRLLGVDEFMAPRKIEPGDVEPSGLTFTLEEAQETALLMRPELAGFRLGVDSARVNAKLKSLRPDLRFIGSYSITDVDTSFSTNKSWNILFNLELPLWDGGKAEAEAEQGLREAEQLSIQLEDLQELVKIEVADAYLAVRESIERINATSATLELAREAKRMAEVGYREGAVTLQDVLSAEVDLSSAMANRLSAVYNYLKAIAQLRKAMGVDNFPGVVGE